MTWPSVLIIFGFTLVLFMLVVLGMAIGLLFGKKRFSSCGGVVNELTTEGSTNCSLCSTPEKACRELARRMKAGGKNNPESSI